MRPLSADQRPWLFLDIDGVINSTWRSVRNDRAYQLTGFADYQTCQAGGFTIAYSPSVVERILSLDANVVWATTWITVPEALEELIAELGITDDLPRLTKVKPRSATACGKAEGIKRWLADDDRPFVWIDDDIGSEDHELCIDHGYDCLLVVPDRDLGITAGELEQIEQFVKLSMIQADNC